MAACKTVFIHLGVHDCEPVKRLGTELLTFVSMTVPGRHPHPSNFGVSLGHCWRKS